jgi:murein DD-endopeptidase MepM/ murein hydrolase activator NlpD
MKSFRLAIVIAVAISCLCRVSAAQNVYGSTTIDIDPNSGTVTATCETDFDGAMDGNYEAEVVCTVTDQNGTQIANGDAADVDDVGFAQVVLTFSATPGSTYTARGIHHAIAILVEQQFLKTVYEDPYNFSSFESDGNEIYPNYNDWYGPGPEEQTKIAGIRLGETTTTAFASTPIQHNYPNNPFDFACWISSFFDATRTTGAHHADDVTQSNGGTSHVAPPLGTPVYAMESGTVVAVSTGQPAASYPACSSLTPRPPGDYAKIKGIDNYTTLYFHMNPSVTVGQQVIAGQQIGVLDNSGCQSAPHLHVGRKDSQGNNVNFTIPCVNPLPTSTTKFNDGSIDDNDPDDW